MTFRLDFHQSAEHTAPLLLGGVLRFGQVAVRLTEVEAYVGRKDPASHAYNGPTPRCETMFGPPQRLYVYASYGIHRAGNLVCRSEEHTSELQSRFDLVCRLLLEKKKSRYNGILMVDLSRERRDD